MVGDEGERGGLGVSYCCCFGVVLHDDIFVDVEFIVVFAVVVVVVVVVVVAVVTASAFLSSLPMYTANKKIIYPVVCSSAFRTIML
jgi:hypothetical protein